jgi:hypothetical protein
MAENLPRIERVAVPGPMILRIRWRGIRTADLVDLTGWVATAGDVLAPLRDEAAFARARVENYGAAVAWDDGDLAIDAVHLKKLAEEQKPFGPDDVVVWQKATKLSNNEAASLIGVSLSTWTGYKAGSPIPRPFAMPCRAVLRDPIMMQAHLRPRVAGRPRNKSAATGLGLSRSRKSYLSPLRRTIAHAPSWNGLGYAAILRMISTIPCCRKVIRSEGMCFTGSVRVHREATHDWRDRQWHPIFQHGVRHNEFSAPGIIAGSADMGDWDG